MSAASRLPVAGCGFNKVLSSRNPRNRTGNRKPNWDQLRGHMDAEEVAKHFTPRYNPWDQRLCLVPNGDMFEAISAGRASVVTDTIETFDETGILLDSGEHLDADIIVTATGLNLVTIGEMDLDIDGEKIDFSELWTYKGLGYSEIPNLISVFGYINGHSDIDLHELLARLVLGLGLGLGLEPC